MRNNIDGTGSSRFVSLLRGIHVILAVMLLGFIYWFPPIDVREDLKLQNEPIADAKRRISEWVKGGEGRDSEDFPFVKLVFAEHSKLVEEIADNANSMYEWFQIKFIFIGAIFGGVFFNLYFRDRRPNREPESGRESDQAPVQIIKDSIIGPISLGVIAISLYVCIAADLHIADRRKGSVEVGLWIRHFVEPIFTGSLKGKWIGWEQFLRDAKDKAAKDEQGDCEPDDGGISGLHFVAKATLLNWVPLHSLTFLIFILYVYVMQEWQLNKPRARRGNFDSSARREVLNNTMFYAVFWLIHLLIVTFTALLHTLSDTLVFRELNLNLGLFCVSFIPNMWYFVIATALLLIVNLIGLGVLRLSASKRQRTGTGDYSGILFIPKS